MLSLSKDDTLVVDMGIEAVKSGQTNPWEVEKFLKRGVKVFSKAGLHAKICVFDQYTIVSSANVSTRSRDYLIEAGLLCRDASLSRLARGFIQSLASEPISQDYINVCKKRYKRPPFKDRRGDSASEKGHRNWLAYVTSRGFNEDEERVSEPEKARALKLIKSSNLYEVDQISWSSSSGLGRKVATGDTIIQLFHDGDKIYACYPERVVRRKEFRSRKSQKVMISLESLKKSKRIPWKQFKKALDRIGLSKVSSESTRSISIWEKETILGLWK